MAAHVVIESRCRPWAFGIGRPGQFLREIPSSTARGHPSSVFESIAGPYAAPAVRYRVPVEKKQYFYTNYNPEPQLHFQAHVLIGALTTAESTLNDFIDSLK